MGATVTHGYGSAAGGPWGSPAGLRILVPGLPQWSWRQRGRAWALLGSYLSALGVGLFAWGTPAGTAMLAVAFLAHISSAADVVRQGAFPGFGRWLPVVSASTGLGLGYAPLLGALWMVAWPGQPSGTTAEGYLVNLWAYRGARPEPGHWVWYEHPGRVGPGLGRVLARAGQEAEWFEGELRVDGRVSDVPPPPLASVAGWTHWILRVPDGHVLLATGQEDPEARTEGPGMLLVAASRVRGRAWAQHAPIWERRLLP